MDEITANQMYRVVMKETDEIKAQVGTDEFCECTMRKINLGEIDPFRQGSKIDQAGTAGDSYTHCQPHTRLWRRP